MEEKVLIFIDSHFTEPINLDLVAESVGLSKCFLSRNFKKITNCGFCDYLNQKRVSNAIELLQNSDMSITEIALLSGFQSISSFNRIFKEITGYSPRAFRKCS